MVSRGSAYRHAVGVVLLVSLILRIALAAAGGQWWWYDETRFQVSLDCVRAIAAGQPTTAAHVLFSGFDHIGFKLLGLIPAAGVATGLPIWTAAAFFGAFSVGTLWLVWRIALNATDDESTGFWAVCVAASSASLFYFSRHLFPYDPALFFGFASIFLATRSRGYGRIWVAGALAGTGTLIYYGYWLFCLVCWSVAVVSGESTFRRVIGRGFVAGIGFAAPILACVLAAYAAGQNPVHSAVAFSATVNNGDFGEGWRFPFDYFWHTEGILLLVWIAAAARFIIQGAPARRAVLPWIAAVVTIYVGLAVGSSVLHRFVEYGRIVRCLVPFMSLVTGAAIADVLRRIRARRVAMLVCGSAVTAMAVAHLASPLAQWFPDAFYTRAREVAWSARPDQRILIQNVHGIRLPEQADPVISGRVLFSRPHPAAYDPYLFEGYRPELRAQFRRTPTTMRVLSVSASDVAPTFPQLHRPPGPVRMTLRLPTANDDRCQPLISTGCGREADILSVIRRGPNRFQFAIYHWPGDETLSPVLALDESKPHVIDVSLGSLVLPEAAKATPKLVGWIRVTVDGELVLNQPQPFYATRPVDIDIGRCLIGGGAPTAEIYRAKIVSVTPIESVATR